MFKNAPRVFSVNSEKEVSKKTPPRHPGFYFALKDKSRKIKVPSSVLIFVALRTNMPGAYLNMHCMA